MSQCALRIFGFVVYICCSALTHAHTERPATSFCLNELSHTSDSLARSLGLVPPFPRKKKKKGNDQQNETEDWRIARFRQGRS